VQTLVLKAHPGAIGKSRRAPPLLRHRDPELPGPVRTIHVDCGIVLVTVHGVVGKEVHGDIKIAIIISHPAVGVEGGMSGPGAGKLPEERRRAMIESGV